MRMRVNNIPSRTIATAAVLAIALWLRAATNMTRAPVELSTASSTAQSTAAAAAPAHMPAPDGDDDNDHLAVILAVGCTEDCATPACSCCTRCQRPPSACATVFNAQSATPDQSARRRARAHRAASTAACARGHGSSSGNITVHCGSRLTGAWNTRGTAAHVTPHEGPSLPAGSLPGHRCRIHTTLPPAR